MEASLVELCSSLEGSRSADLGGGVRAVRAYDELRLEGVVTGAPGGSRATGAVSSCASRRPGDRLAGRSRKVQDVLVDAKVPRDERDGWPLVATMGGEVVAVPGVIEAPGWEGVVRATREPCMTSVHADVGEVLIDEDALRSRIVELGAEISTDYEGRDLLLVGVLKGAIFFISDLMRELTVPCEIDFMAISSYGAATDSSGVVRILKDLELNIAGRDVLVVEDIIDSGLDALVSPPHARGAEARLTGDLRAADEAGAPRGRRAGAVRRLRDPEPVRDRLRARLRRALPEPPLHRRPASRSDSGGN